MEKKAERDLKKLKSSEGTRDDSKEDQIMDMEFEGDSKVQPPPL